MGKDTKVKLDEDVITMDIPAIAAEFQGDKAAAKECETMLMQGLERIRLNPPGVGKQCKYPPLQHCRSLKVYASKALEIATGTRPALRIVYDYDQAKDTVNIRSMGFRRAVMPRPDDDPYSKASKRIDP